MAYIYKKIVKGKTYYYLRVSKRIKGKIIVKDIAYLGNDPTEIRKKLDELPEAHTKEIRKTYKKIKKSIESEYYLDKIRKQKLKTNHYLEKKLLEEIEANKLHFTKRFLKLDSQTIREVYKQFLIEFAYNTTSLEGNTITLEEAQRLLEENLTPKDKTLREIYDLQNTERVFFDIIDTKKNITHNLIIKIHDELMKNIDKRKGYRASDIHVFKSRFNASPGQYVKIDMELLLKWYAENEKKLHPLILCSLFHQKFEKIHPFSDGNGRTGRMILNYILMKKGYPPLIVRKSRRGDYLDALGKADESNIKDIETKHFNELVQFMAEEMIDSYWTNFLV